jgi:predicted DNA-binding protein (UPF0251 family)
MPRPVRNRKIDAPPMMEGFKPFGVPMKLLEPVILLYEEYEAIRLADYEGLTQEQGAEKMQVSRPTFTRIYEKARKSVARAFVEGKAIFIEGGNYDSDYHWYRCENCHKLNISEQHTGCCRYCHSTNLRELNERVTT